MSNESPSFLKYALLVAGCMTLVAGCINGGSAETRTAEIETVINEILRSSDGLRAEAIGVCRDVHGYKYEGFRGFGFMKNHIKEASDLTAELYEILLIRVRNGHGR